MYIYIYIDIYIVSILHIGVGLETLKLGLPSRQERLGPHPWAPRVGAQRRGHGRPGAGRAPAAGGQSQSWEWRAYAEGRVPWEDGDLTRTKKTN